MSSFRPITLYGCFFPAPNLDHWAEIKYPSPISLFIPFFCMAKRHGMESQGSMLAKRDTTSFTLLAFVYARYA